MRKQIWNVDNGRRNTKRAIIGLALCLACLALPQGVALGAEYYCDPVNGDITNDGSAGSPWGRVQEVFATKLDNPVTGGDTIYLRNGYHGDIVCSNQHNADYITVEAQAGHTPGLRRIRLVDVGYWIFRGLTISPELAPTYNPSNPERYLLFEVKGSSTNVTLEDSELYFINDSSGWSASDWAALFVPRGWSNGVGGIVAVNISAADQTIIRNNTLRNVYFGICLDEEANNTLVEYNTIENIAGDGMGAHTSNVVIQYNILKNFYDVDGNHDDGIQSFTTTGERFDNIVIRGNYILSREPGLTNELLTRDGPMGITAHSRGISQGCPDGSCYSNWVIENNVIIEEHSVWGIHLADPRDSIIRNNIAVNPTGPQYQNLIIGIDDGGLNTTIVNNMASLFPPNAGTIVSHSNLNLEDYNNWDVLFVDWQNLDLRHADSSPAIDAGTAENAPSIDILGNPRPQGAGYDIGAYEYPGSLDDTPPTVSANLTAQAVSESQIDLSWLASDDPESGIRYYRIYRDTVQIDTSGSTSYPDTGLANSTTYAYEVSAVNGAGLESGLSNTAQATTLADLVAPDILSVGASESEVIILFSEELDSVSAEQISNYTINNGISVIAASLSIDTVTLTVSTQAEGTYTLTVTGVEDTSGNAMAQTQTNYQYTEGLVGHWAFDEGTGTVAVDASGNLNDAILLNGPTWTQGILGGAVSLDGLNDAIEIGTNNFDAGQGTISLWAYAESFASSNYLFGHTTEPAWANRIQLYTDITGDLGLGLGNSHSTQTNIQTLDLQRWYHIAFSWDGTDYIVYVDGVPMANGTYAGLSNLNTFADIGNDGYSSARDEAFNGRIDEVRIYNRALTEAEIVDLCNSCLMPILYGDVSENGSISGTDASMAARYSVALITLSTDQITAADVTGNGSVSGSDAGWIARKAVDPTLVFPVEQP